MQASFWRCNADGQSIARFAGMIKALGISS